MTENRAVGMLPGQRLHETKQKSAISPSSSCGTARMIGSSSCSGARPLT
jgi:hypothetical protein